MTNTSSVDELLERHRAFWQMLPLEAPLIGASRGQPLAFDDFDWGRDDEGLLTPEMLDVKSLVAQIEQRSKTAGFAQRDVFWFAEPPKAIPWMEAIMGCPLHFSASGHSIWPEPCVVDWSDLDALPSHRESPWLRLLLELMDKLAALARGRFPVAMPLQRGPVDVVAAMRGMNQMCLDVYDHPDRFKQLLDACTDVSLHVARLLAGIIPAFRGGHVNYFGVWAPGWPYLHQQDGMASLSPRLYAQTVRDGDEKLMGAFDYSIRKFHSSSLHILDQAISLPCVKGVQVTIDPTGPTLHELVPTLRRLQKQKPLIVNCTSEETMETLQAALSPDGLCLHYWEAAQGLAKLDFNQEQNSSERPGAHA